MYFSKIFIISFMITIFLGEQAAAQSVHPLKFLSKQCNEYAIEMRLEPRPFQDYVGSDFSLALEKGKAIVLIIVQDCSQYWIDGEDLGPAQDVHVWVSIQGIDDLRPVVGAELTKPTRTWFALFVGSSNPRVRVAKMAAGTTIIPIDSVSLDLPSLQNGGRIYFTRNLSYSWQLSSLVTPSTRIVGVNNNVYTKDSSGNILMNVVQALLHVSEGPSQGTLKVRGNTDLLPWISAGTYPVSISTFFPMWSRATLGISPSH
jgi:hypothetical protein